MVDRVKFIIQVGDFDIELGDDEEDVDAWLAVSFCLAYEFD